ncbi:DUF6011 domain-containing protein [Kitasatospora sp. MBT63]|uniref:DUF6011 domain-containing protein n=1 Tax=Kitasatospora sp. MBT63 TaxID=1444768 RepID=UPI000539DA3D|nr:DUF6011 domain-containing protein [Kitasatospora sp. MBT63]
MSDPALSVPALSDPALIPPIPARLPAEVRCLRCGRLLHDPESRMLRLGRECRRPSDPVRVVAGEQEALPGMMLPSNEVDEPSGLPSPPP